MVGPTFVLGNKALYIKHAHPKKPNTEGPRHTTWKQRTGDALGETGYVPSRGNTPFAFY